MTNITDIDRAVWVIGVLRDPVINYRAANGFMEARRPYWVTRFTSAQDAVRRPTSYNCLWPLNASQVYAFAADFPEACRRANDLDARILSGASYISAAYGDLVSLAARQAAAGMELTVGSLESDVKMFMRGAGGVK